MKIEKKKKKAQQGAAGAKVPMLDKFRSIILLSKMTH